VNDNKPAVLPVFSYNQPSCYISAIESFAAYVAPALPGTVTISQAATVHGTRLYGFVNDALPPTGS
jgi:hypothetical protein